ncbi:hypothetical protein EON65_57855 [archaeon]|nr:MAG: hypothetical protein EON65_57855 [archaeon]
MSTFFNMPFDYLPMSHGWTKLRHWQDFNALAESGDESFSSDPSQWWQPPPALRLQQTMPWHLTNLIPGKDVRQYTKSTRNDRFS